MKCLIGTAVLLAALLGAANAAAHAVLESTTPADGAAVSSPPAAVVLRFNEPVLPVAVQLMDGSGKVHAGNGSVSTVDNELRIALPRELPNGAYLVSYRVVSADAHPIGGGITFAIGEGAAAWHGSRPPQADTGTWSAMIIANRAVCLAALMIAMGGAMTLLLAAGDPRSRRRELRGLLVGAIAIAATTAMLAIGLHGGQMVAAEPGELLGALAPWRQGIASSQGGALLATLAGLTGLLAGLLVHGRILSAVLLVAGCTSILGSFALAGHAATASPRALALCVWLLHAGAAAFWVGSLAPLLVSLRDETPKAAATLGRFSNVALPVVGVLIAAGLAMAIIQAGDAGALVSTAYGGVLLAKIALVCVMLTLAVINRFFLLPRLLNAAPLAHQWLRRSIRAELALGLLVLVVAAALSQQVPPVLLRGGGDTSAPGVGVAGSLLKDARGRSASLSLEKSGPADHTLGISLRDAAGSPLQALEVRVALSLPGRAVGALSRQLIRVAEGEYRYRGPDFVVAGEWRVRIQVLIGDFEQTEFETTATIKP